MSISLTFDVAIAAILLLCLIIGGRRGFIRSLLSVVILVVSLVGGSIAANVLADPVTEWVTPRVERYMLDRLTNGRSEEAVSAAAASDSAALGQIVDFDAITGIAKKAMDSAVEAGKNLLEGAVTGMIRSLVYAVLFIQIGFIPATVIVPPVILFAVGCRKWSYYGIYYAFAAVMYLLFRYVLLVPIR